MIRYITAALVAAGLALAPAAQAETFYVGGTGVSSQPTRPTNLDWVNHGGPATQIGYPAAVIGMDGSIKAGVDALDAAVQAATGPVTIVGTSQGAVVVNQYRDSGRAPAGTTFVMVADPTNRNGIMGRNPGLHIPGVDLTFVAAKDSPYPTTVISREYDGVADWPVRQGNILADLNAIAGIFYIHPHYGTVDLTGVTPVVVGNTTYYRLPTAHLPLLQPLRDLGIDARIVNAIEGPLRQIIDSAYRPHGATVAPAVTPVKTKPAAHEPKVRPQTHEKRKPPVARPPAVTGQKPIKPARPTVKKAEERHEHREKLTRDEHRQSDQRRPERRAGNPGVHGRPAAGQKHA